jgi:hypothetical protein
MSEEIYLSLIEQGPVFFILAVLLGSFGYAGKASAAWLAETADKWVCRHLDQMDSLIDENKKDRQVYLDSMEKLNNRLDKHEATLSRIEKMVS